MLLSNHRRIACLLASLNFPLPGSAQYLFTVYGWMVITFVYRLFIEKYRTMTRPRKWLSDSVNQSMGIYVYGIILLAPLTGASRVRVLGRQDYIRRVHKQLVTDGLTLIRQKKNFSYLKILWDAGVGRNQPNIGCTTSIMFSDPLYSDTRCRYYGCINLINS